MKKVVLPLFCVFAAAQVFAQSELENFAEEGRATWEIATSGMWAAHPTLPIGSTPTIRNVATGRETLVTVIGRIPASRDRVIDVSAEAAHAIGLVPGARVQVYFPTNVAPVHAELPGPDTPGLPPGANVTFRNEGTDITISNDGANIVIRNHVIPHSALPEWLARLHGEPAAGVQPATAVPFGAPEGLFEILPVPPALPPHPRVTPGFPDPNSGRVYRLQVGSWENMNGALTAFLQLLGADFSTAHEYSSGAYRVYAIEIPASEVYGAVWRLAYLGFEEIYVWAQ